jgi:hypothetical protein
LIIERFSSVIYLSLLILTTGDAIPADGLYVDVSSASVNFSKKLKANDPILVKLNKLIKNDIAADTKANVVITDSNDTVWFETTSEVDLCGDLTPY